MYVQLNAIIESLFERENTLSLLLLLLLFVAVGVCTIDVRMIGEIDLNLKAFSSPVAFDLTNSFCFRIASHMDEATKMVGKGWALCTFGTKREREQQININKMRTL